jgi:hypothetical protein
MAHAGYIGSFSLHLVVAGAGVPLQRDPFLADTTLEYRPK